jgi:CBS domain-containing protein
MEGNMLKIIKVSQYMTKDLICFAPGTALTNAIETLLQNKISGAPVVNAEGKLVGMLSEGDCLKGILTGSYFEEAGVRVGDVMSEALHTVDEDTDIVKAAECFVEHGLRRLPVMEEGRLVGQISRRDVLRAVRAFNDTGGRR